jgi:hypothetical protein
MKKYHYVLITVFFPFIVMWTVWLLTAFSFEIREAFTSSVFIGLSVVYYAVIIWAPLHIIIEHYDDKE